MEKINSEAIFLTKYGNASQAFQVQAIELNSPSNLEVLIEVEAFGLNYADVMARNNLYKEAPPLPCVLGYEVVGKITAVGNEVSTDWIGKRVVAFTRFGGYAKHTITPLHAIAAIDELPAEEALALSTQFVTAYYMACYLTPIHASDRVLIHAAAGGVGTALIQLCKWKKATVIAKIGSESKRTLVEKLGADFVVNYAESPYETQIERILQAERIDVSFNPVAGSTFKKDFKLLGSGGRLILFGGSERSGKKMGIFSSLNFVRKMGLVIPIGLMMRSKSVLGVNMLKIADNKPAIIAHCLEEVVKLSRQGILTPQVGTKFSVDEIVQAHSFLESGTSTGKIAVFWNKRS